MAEPEDQVPSILLPCTICNRTFKPETLEKHSKICEKNASKKRKLFDSSKQRIQGTELAEFLPVIPKKEKSPVKKPQSLWKQKHLEFVRAIRQARGVEVPGKRTLSAVEQSRPAIHEKCPHCERNFGPKAFDRHIEWCKEQKTRIPKSPANIIAKERLEARTKYRAPLSKSKRSITREKYSPVMRGGGGGVREPSPMGSRSSVSVSNSSQTAAAGMPSIRGIATCTSGSAPSSQCSSARKSLSSPSCSMQRNTASRSSIQRPTKRPSVVKKDSVAGKEKSPKKNSTNEDLFSSSCSITRISPPGKSKAAVSVPVVTKNRKNEVRSPSPASPHQLNKTSISRATIKKHNALPDGSLKQPIKSISSEDSQICAGAETVVVHEEQRQHADVKPKLGNNDTSKMSLKKGKYVRKFNQHNKINSIDVNDDTVLSCNIYPSSRNLVTWQELATGGADNNIETKLNETYTVAEFENTNVDVLKLDLLCSSPETELQASCATRPEDDDKRIEINLQNLYLSNNPENSYKRSDLNNRESSKNHNLSNSSIDSSSDRALESLYAETRNDIEPSVHWECVSNRESSESADAVADDEGIDGDVSAAESYILTGSNDNQLPIALVEEQDCEDGDIWEIAARDFIKEENFDNFYAGLENNQSYSTPVKTETHYSFISSENNDMNFDDSKMKTKKLMFSTIKNKLKCNMSAHLLTSKSKSWGRRYFIKEKWLAALREKTIVNKSMDDFLLGPKFPKRKKLQDCNMEWCCKLITPFSFCAAKNETPFMFKSVKEKQIKYRKLSKSEHSFCPKPDLNSNRQSESLSACNRRKKRAIRHRKKCNHYESMKNDNSIKLREGIGKCISADSLEQEGNNGINVVIEYFGCRNSESEISTENNVSQEQFNDIYSKNASSLNSYSESDKKQITAVFNKNVKKIENLENAEFNRSKSLSVINTEHAKYGNEPQKKSMFPAISKVSNRINSNKTILNLSESIKREINADGVDCVVSLQEINLHSFELQDCELVSQEKLVLPDINSCKSSIVKEVKASKKRKEKSSFWEQQSQGVQPRSGIPVRTRKGVYSKNPNSKKLPPLICSSIQKRNRFPRFMKGTLAPSIPNVQLILNNSDVTSGEAYDPYVSAERQMMELLSGDWSQPSEEKNVAESENQIISSPSPPPKEFRTSPTSAFAVNPKADAALQPPRSDQNSPPLFDFEELIISGHNTSSMCSPHNMSLSALYDENDANHKELMISLSSICSTPSFDLNFELNTNVNRKSNRAKYRKKLENAALALQQSVSRYHPGPVVTESQLEEDDVLLAAEIHDVFSNTLLSHSSPESKLASMSSFQNCEDLSFQRKNGAIVVQVEEEHDSQVNRRSIGSKVSGDSAYSSLNRKSPVADINSQTLERHTEVLLDADIHCLSSSGSESSLPPLCSTQVEGRRVKSPLLSSTPTPTLLSGVDQSSSPKMSKFCHECGSKYPVSLAKFCCECGVRRLFV